MTYVPRFLMIAALLAAGCVSAPLKPGPYHLALAGPTRRAPPLEGPMKLTPPGMTVELEPLTAEAREAWLAARAGITPDPFVTTLGGRPFLAVRVSMAATGTLPVHWESQGTRLWPADPPGALAPLDYAQVYEWLRPDRTGETGSVERIMKGLFDGSVQLRPGERREALLVFPAPPLRKTEILLEIPFLQVGETTHRLHVPMIAVYSTQPKGTKR